MDLFVNAAILSPLEAPFNPTLHLSFFTYYYGIVAPKNSFKEAENKIKKEAYVQELNAS
jgi:hypothetical protein